MSSYEEIRPLLRDGDVAFFSSHRTLGDYIIKSWSSLVTEYDHEFSHVGTVYLLEKRVFLLEASAAGGVRMVPLGNRQPDKVVQLQREWNDVAGEWAFAMLGKKYSMWEAIAAGLGMKADEDDKAFICTEYVAGICERLGYSLPHRKQLPSIFYHQMKTDGFNILTIDNPLNLLK
jgi:hypothetical protein